MNQPEEDRAMLKLTFYTLTGKFSRVREETFATEAAALAAVKAYASQAGYTNIKFVVDDDLPECGGRFTGRTPGGRAGRNIAGAWRAEVDHVYSEECG
jgi:hypothetical protein